MDVLSLTVQKELLEYENILENEKLRSSLGYYKAKNKRSNTLKPTNDTIEPFSYKKFSGNDKLFKYYTGFSNADFHGLFTFLVPDPTNPSFTVTKNMHLKIGIMDQLFFTLCKLRNNFDFMDLSYRFKISIQDCSSLFGDWINFMYLRFGEINILPPCDVIIDNMPENYRKDFPDTIAIIDCTEVKIEKPSSLPAQSQSYSDYKATNTLKALVAVDPRGSLLFSSCLFSGGISDKEIFEESGFRELLQQLILHGHLREGDGLMADKGFNVKNEVEDVCKLWLNIPPFAQAGTQMSQADVMLTKKIAAHRVHVERTIGSIKKFKIVAHRIPLSLFG